MSGQGRPYVTDQQMVAIYGEEFWLKRLLRDVGRDLRALREEAGIGQRELAGRCDMAQTQVLRGEQGDTLGISLRTIARQAEGLGYRIRVTFEPFEAGEDASTEEAV